MFLIYCTSKGGGGTVTLTFDLRMAKSHHSWVQLNVVAKLEEISSGRCWDIKFTSLGWTYGRIYNHKIMTAAARCHNSCSGYIVYTCNKINLIWFLFFKRRLLENTYVVMQCWCNGPTLLHVLFLCKQFYCSKLMCYLYSRISWVFFKIKIELVPNSHFVLSQWHGSLRKHMHLTLEWSPNNLCVYIYYLDITLGRKLFVAGAEWMNQYCF